MRGRGTVSEYERKIMAERAPAFQFYPQDWLACDKVAEMTLEEEGVYIRLLCYCWTVGSIPVDPERCARLAGKGCSVQTATSVQRAFNACSTDPQRLVHKRLEKERTKQAERREQQSEAGKRSAAARKKPLNGVVAPATDSTSVEHPLNERSTSVQRKGNSSSSSSSSSSEEEKKAPPAESRIAEPQTLPRDFPEHPSEVVIPAKVNTPDCHRAMRDWQRHLDAGGAPNAVIPGSPQEEHLWQWAGRMGPKKFIESVSYSIAQGSHRLMEKWDTATGPRTTAKANDPTTDARWLNVLSIHQKTDDSPKGRAERNERLTAAEREAGAEVKIRTRIGDLQNDFQRKALAAEFLAALKIVEDREASRENEFERVF